MQRLLIASLKIMFRPGIFEFINMLRNENAGEMEEDEFSSESSASESDYSSSDDESINSGSSLSEQSGASDSSSDVEGNFISKNGQMVWNRRQPVPQGRRNRQNIVHQNCGPAPHVQPQTIYNSFTYFFTDDMIRLIVQHTNAEAIRVLQNPDNWNPVCCEEMIAFFGILYIMGTLRGSRQRLRDFWDSSFGLNAIIATMSLNRFKYILRFLRFDDKNTRRQRKAEDRLASTRDLWELFLRNCRRSIIPSPFLVVDEQITPTRGRCPLRVYMPNKPHKYGIKTWVLGDSVNGYFCDGEIYLRPRGAPERHQAQRIVMQLCGPYFNSGRNITCDRYFSSIPLAQQLFDNGLTFLGTLNKSKAEIPQQFISRNLPLHSTLFAYHDRMQLSSYMATQTKFVLLLSTYHSNNHINEDVANKPDSIVDYNLTKCGVDLIDQMVNTFSTRRKTRRWPMTIFFNILDLCALNGYFTWRLRNPNWNSSDKSQRRTLYLKELSLSLMNEWMVNRTEDNPKGANQPKVKRARMSVLGDANVNILNNPVQDLQGRCNLCGPLRRRVKSVCNRCHNFSCKIHSVTICNNCQQ